MFDFGMGELVLIFVVALVVLGPEKLPEVAKTLGKGLSSLKKSLDEVKKEVKTGLDDIKDTSGIKEAMNEGAAIKKSLLDMTQQVKTDFKDASDLSPAEPAANAAVKNSVKEKSKEGSEGNVQKIAFW